MSAYKANLITGRRRSVSTAFTNCILYMAFANAGFNFAYPAVFALGVPETPYLSQFLYFPAAVAGAFVVFQVKSFSRSVWIILPCLAAALSILWTDASEQGRGLLITYSLLLPVPLSALIIRTSSVVRCAKVFVTLSVVGVVVSIIAIAKQNVLVSRLVLYGGIDPNHFAAHIVCAIMLYVGVVRRMQPVFGQNRVGIRVADVSLVVLVPALLMTGSRGGVAALACGLLTLVFVRRSKIASRMSIATAACFILIAVYGLVSFAIDVTPHSTLVDRLQREDVSRLGGRLPIWKSAILGVASDPTHVFFGVGIGGVDKQIVQYAYDVGLGADEVVRGSVRGEDGVWRRQSHSSYVEWLCALGIFGAFIGLFTGLPVVARARKLDRLYGTSVRQALIITLLFLSLTLVAYRISYWVGYASILLSLLSISSQIDFRRGGQRHENDSSTFSPDAAVMV